MFQNPMCLKLRGLLRARSRFPEIVENIKNRKQRMEFLEWRSALAKQVFCLLRNRAEGNRMGRTLLPHQRSLRKSSLKSSCVRTVRECIVFSRLELALSEKQIPRFVGNVSS